MSDFNTLLKRQYEVGKSLDQALSNFKKDGPTRWDNEEYLVTKLKIVKKFWTDLKSNHEQLRVHVGFPPSRYAIDREFDAFFRIANDFANRIFVELAKIPSYVESDPTIVNAAEVFASDKIAWEKALEERCVTISAANSASTSALSKGNEKPNPQLVMPPTLVENPTLTVPDAGSSNNTEQFYSPAPNQMSFNWAEEVANESRVQSFHLQVKLPKMEIPKFSGDIRTWRTFHDMFSKLVHEKAQLSDIEKFTYLRTYLEGEPLSLLAHFSVSAATYAIAWQTLISRYHNVRALIDAELDFLLEPINNKNNSSIRILHDTTRESLYNLKALGCEVDVWDPILVRITMRKMDDRSISAFEDTLDDTKVVPKLETLLKFLEKRFFKLDQVKLMKPSNGSKTSSSNAKVVRANAARSSSGKSVTCFLCKESHPLYKCAEFLKKSPSERLAFAQQENLCVNCLSHKKNGNCKSNFRCKTCNKFHHNLLHLETTKVNHSVTSSPSVLPTAIILVSGQSGQQFQLRALIDSGSQESFISREAAQLVQAKMSKTSVVISGVGIDGTLKASQSAKIQLRSRVDDSFLLNLEALVLPSLTGFLPGPPKVSHSKWMNDKYPTPLADSASENVVDVDLILGSDCFASILSTSECIRKSADNFAALPTVFGWVIQGQSLKKEKNRTVSVNTLRIDESTLHELWELPSEPSEVKEIELSFTFEIAEDGKFIVKYPFKRDAKLIGESRRKALARFFSIERMMNKDAKMKEQYVAFMNEYIDLKHMTLVSSYVEPGDVEYFIPHHPVVKEDSLTTKVRVVFDGSAKGDLGQSLNDVLHTGPLLLNNLWEILLRFRMNKIAFVADICKMYRCIWIHPDQRKFQKIFWRNNSDETVKEYELNSVTYGVASSPYLAIACLKQIAHDNQEKFPRSSSIVEDDSYVDDVISGDVSVNEAKKRVKEISEMLLERGFPLKKWACSHPEVLSEMPEEDRVEHFLEIGKDTAVKTLGIEWNFSKDVFRVIVKDEIPTRLTKRSLLSFVAKVFDPLGWLSPVLIRAKLLIQETWQLKLDWDTQVPKEIETKFVQLYADIGKLQALEIPRFCDFNSTDFQLIGFCDASGRAHGAAVYIKVPGAVHLLASKSKVNPLKEKVSLPRLELLSAVLLAELIAAVKAALPYAPRSIHCFSDSEVVLCWLKNPAVKFKVFVGNRVEKIVSLTSRDCWKHVRSEDNIADVISRGTTTDKFLELAAWWSGPEWVSRNVEDFPTKNVEMVSMNHAVALEFVNEDECVNEKVHKKKLRMTADFDNRQLEMMNRIDSWLKLVRISSYCLRICMRVKDKHLTVCELRRGEARIVQLVQRASFEEYQMLLKGKEITSGSLKSLSPFIDEDGLMRVGGRLQNSQLSYDQKHPMILPSNHHVTALLIRHAHAFTLHGAQTEVSAFLRHKYWIIRMKDAVKKELFKCLKCFQFKAKPLSQPMGNLPAVRITPAAAFQNVGLDFAGPIKIRANLLRRPTIVKAYLCIFVCMSTKCMHIEVVSDLTTKAFMSALKRFFARRGYSNNIYSDNGKTFLGAKSKLNEQEKVLQKYFEEDIFDEMSKLKIQWHFIPPYSAWFGGLWEAGVKSTKYHLKRMTEDQLFTFEELTTIVVQIEGILNSRPLCPMSDDPSDLDVLTPAHFLIGRALNLLPEGEIIVKNINHVDRFKRCQIKVQAFWKKWSNEYLARLQQRPKWLESQTNLQEGDLVLVREEFLPVASWKKARVTECHPGNDGRVRVVTLFDGAKMFKRPIRLLSKLPIDNPQAIPLPIQKSKGQKSCEKVTGMNDRKNDDPIASSSSMSKPKKKVSFEIPTTSKIETSDQPTLRRSYRIEKRGTKLNLIFLCLTMLMVVTPSDALFKNAQVESNGIFVHHKKTAIPTKGRTSLVFTSDVWVSQVSEQLSNSVGLFKVMCSELPDPKTWSFCKNATNELDQYVEEFEAKRESFSRRAKRSSGLIGTIFHTVKVFLFGASSSELEAKEEEDFNRLGEIQGNMAMDSMITKQKLVSRDQAVQREFSHLFEQIAEKSDDTRVHVYLNQAFATVIRVIEHAEVVFETTPHLIGKQAADMKEYIEKLIPNRLLTVDQLIKISLWSVIDLEPITYIQTFPLLDGDVFEEILIVPVPDFRTGMMASVKNSNIIMSISSKQYIIDDNFERVAINETLDLIVEPTIIYKVSSKTPCEIRRMMYKESCALDLHEFERPIDKWVALSNGEIIYMTESFQDYTVTCDEKVETLTFPVGVITADNCVIEDPDKIIQTNAHKIDTGHGYHYHVPIKFFDTPPALEKTDNFTTLSPIDLESKVEESVWMNLNSPSHHAIMKYIDLLLSMLILALILVAVIYWRVKKTKTPAAPKLQNYAVV